MVFFMLVLSISLQNILVKERCVLKDKKIKRCVYVYINAKPSSWLPTASRGCSSEKVLPFLRGNDLSLYANMTGNLLPAKTICLLLLCDRTQCRV